jgi:hypothetical protein
MYTFGKPYARGGAVFPGKGVRVLKIEGKCSCVRAKAAHISGHLPSPRLERHGVLHHLVILLDNQVPANGTTQHPREVGQCAGHPGVREVEAFVFQALEPGHQAHPAQQVTKGERDLGLAMGIN